MYIRNFWRSRACNSKVTDSIRPEFELCLDYMSVLVTSKFDEDPIKNERASLETPFSHYKFMGIFFKNAQGHLTPKGRRTTTMDGGLLLYYKLIL